MRHIIQNINFTYEGYSYLFDIKINFECLKFIVYSSRQRLRITIYENRKYHTTLYLTLFDGQFIHQSMNDFHAMLR